MVLSNANLNHVLSKSNPRNYLRVDPLLDNSIQPASIDLHLDSKLLVEIPQNTPIKPGLDKPRHRLVDISNNVYTLQPGDFVLGGTIEKVGLNNALGSIVLGKSSLARIGLTVAPGFIDPGFVGNITLEIFNVSQNAIYLSKGMGICQMVSYILADPAKTAYGDPSLGSKYQNQQGATAAKPTNDNTTV